jgi:hypothetical protein
MAEKKLAEEEHDVYDTHHGNLPVGLESRSFDTAKIRTRNV